MTPEGKIEKHLRKRVRGTHGRVRKLRWIGRRGAPDNLVWWPPANLYTCLVECKRPGGPPPTKQQEKTHRDMREDGWRIFVVDSEAAVDTMIEEMLN